MVYTIKQSCDSFGTYLEIYYRYSNVDSPVIAIALEIKCCQRDGNDRKYESVKLCYSFSCCEKGWEW